MSTLTPLWAPLLAATESDAALRALEFDLPGTAWGWAVLLGGLALVVLLSVFVYFRDTAELSPFWKTWLIALRLTVLAAIVLIALNPQERMQKLSFRPSRVALLVDTSLSMRHPETQPPAGAESPGSQQVRSRAEAVRALLANTPLLDELRRQHEVSVYTFDSTLAGPHHIFPRETATAGGNASEPDSAPRPVDWNELVEPRGLETRLGESLIDVIRQIGGRTLSGVVVVSDGASNAGIEPDSAHERAVAARTRLVTVGVGDTTEPINLHLADIQAPTDVQKGDAYEISAFVQGQGLSGRSVDVEILMKPAEEDGEPTVVETRQITLLEDGIPVEVKFQRNPGEAGRVEYTVRAQPAQAVRELNRQDNVQTVTVNVFDRPTRVLLFAGGPMRDYQFVRNALHRHPSFEVDVLLQTGTVGISQDARNLLLEFPSAREDLFEYDVIIAFDPDWSALKPESVQLLNEWVSNESGGLILVAGDVHVQQLGGGSEALKPLRELYPVILSSHLIEFQFDQESTQPWPVQFTQDGRQAGFLQIAEDAPTSTGAWKQFAGIYRSFPTSGAKAGATVYAHFTDPRSQSEHGFPVLFASQFYGQGRTFFIGSPEMWRLRAVDEEYYDRFWIKAIREVGQGRMRRGTRRGLLLLENKRQQLGQTVRVRARLLSPQFQPLEAGSVPLEVYDPVGRPLVPARRLTADPNRPGEFVGDFRGSQPGTYKLELAIPESNERLNDEVTIALPRLEDESIRQNAKLLTELAQDTGGAYLRLDEAETQLAALLPNRGEEFLVDERLRTLWDRQWVMFLLVGLLSAEWLTRKLLKLA